MSEKVKLEYRLKQGDVSKYKTLVESGTEITEEGETKAINSVMEMMTTQTITNVAADGSMGVEVAIDSASLKRDGEELPVPSIGQKIPMKMKGKRRSKSDGRSSRSRRRTDPCIFPRKSCWSRRNMVGRKQYRNSRNQQNSSPENKPYSGIFRKDKRI